MNCSPLSADLLIRAGHIYTMSPVNAPQRAIAMRGDSILATSSVRDDLDALATTETRIIDDPTLTVLPAFNDTHNHLLEATRNATFVPVNRARSLGEFVALIADRAAQTPKGRWVQTSNAWHEQQLEEHRLPTAAD